MKTDFVSPNLHQWIMGRLRLKVDHLSFLAFSAEEEAILESILRDRSHIEDTLRLAADEKSGDYAGKGVKACVPRWTVSVDFVRYVYFIIHVFICQLHCRGWGRSTTAPSDPWNRPTSTTSWDNTRSQVQTPVVLLFLSVLVCLLSPVHMVHLFLTMTSFFSSNPVRRTFKPY